MRKKVTAAMLAALVGSVLLPATAFAHECFNISKHEHAPAAGAQVVIDVNTDEVVWATKGVENRIEQGIIDPESGEGFHGILGLDFDGDGSADVTTWQVTPTGEIPEVAQESGSPDHGVVQICAAGICGP